MPLKVWDGSAFKEGQSLRVWNGSSWVAANTAHVWNGSEWKLFFPAIVHANGAIFSIGTDSSTSTATIAFRKNGTTNSFKNNADGSSNTDFIADWLSPASVGSGSAFQIKIIENSIVTPTGGSVTRIGYTSGQANTWLNFSSLSTNTSSYGLTIQYVDQSPGDFSLPETNTTANLTIQIGKSNTVIATANYSLDASTF